MFPADAIKNLISIAIATNGTFVGHYAELLKDFIELATFFLPKKTSDGAVVVYGAGSLTEEHVNLFRDLGLALGAHNAVVQASDPDVVAGPLVSQMIAHVIALLAAKLQDPDLWRAIIQQILDSLQK